MQQNQSQDEEIYLIQHCEQLRCSNHHNPIIGFNLSPDIPNMNQRLQCNFCDASKQSFVVKHIENLIKTWLREFQQIEEGHSRIRGMAKRIQEMIESIIVQAQKYIKEVQEIQQLYFTAYDWDEKIRSFKEIKQIVQSSQPQEMKQIQKIADFCYKQNQLQEEQQIFYQQRNNYLFSMQTMMWFECIPNMIKQNTHVNQTFMQFQKEYSLQHYHNMKCNSCGLHIIGNRYDYEDKSYCFDCYSINLKNNKLISKQIEVFESESSSRILIERQELNQIQNQNQKDNSIKLNQLINYCIKNDVHSKLICSVCEQKGLRGNVYKCQDCLNFVCCQNCFHLLKDHYPLHKFMELEHFHEQISCNRCLVPEIIGVRYQCMACSNFNMCSYCYKEREHQGDHQFKVVEGESIGVFRRNILWAKK